MPARRADALTKTLARGTRGGVWFMQGDEEWLREEATSVLVAAHLDPGTRDFNLDQLRGSSLDPEALLSICHTPPMIAEWRVVIVRDLQAVTGSARLRSAIESVLEPIPGLALILSAGDVTDAKFWTTVRKKAHTIDCAPLAVADLPGWLIERAAQRGTTLEPGAARALAAAIGSDLGVLAQELDKLIAYSAERASIGVEDVESMVGHVPRINRWDWIDTVGEARFREARTNLNAMLDGDSGVSLIIGLGAQLLRLGIALSGGQRALAAILPQNQQWLSRRLMTQARQWNARTIDAALEDLARADRLLKSASLDARQVMDELLLRFEARRSAA
ncbi:MAG: DNA polymerase III subunit delta [Gemmatimonadetes bacterium]|nr:DNA polymerase III subunit delta [Gemmatimonadota bacterium]